MYLLMTSLLLCRQRGEGSENCQNLVNVIYGWPHTICNTAYYYLIRFLQYQILLASIEIVSDIKNFLPGDPVGVARMSETLWGVENLLRLGWTSSPASRPRKLASKCDFQEWPRKIHEIVQNIHKCS